MKMIPARLLIGLAVCLAWALQAQAISVTNTTPRGWDFTSATNAMVSIDLDAPLGGLPQFTLHSRWRGIQAGYLTSMANRVEFTPTNAFLPGEMLEASLAGLTTNFTWRFQAAPQGGSATMTTNNNSRIINSIGGSGIRNIALADLNSNRTLEVIAPAFNKSTVYLASGNPAVTSSVTLAGMIQDVTVADFNLDGKPDLLLGCATQMLVVATNAGNGQSFGVAAQTIAGVSGPLRQVVAGDLDGDGDPDAMAIAETSQHLIPFLNNGSGVLNAGTPIALSFTPLGLEAGDLNGDGLVDAVVVGQSGNVAVMLNSAGTLQAPVIYGITNQTLYACRIADFNRDGQADLVVVGAGGVVFVGMGGPGGLVFSQVDHPFALSTLYGVGVGDFDADGLPDIITCGGDHVAMLIGAGSSFLTYLDPVLLPGELLRDIEVGDRDGDGRLDATVCGVATGSVYTLWNSPASFPVLLGTNQLPLTSGAPSSLSLGTDFGLKPLLTSATNTFQIANRGAGVLQIGQTPITGAQASAFQILGVPAVIQPGVTSTFQVVFSPAFLGLHQAELQITNNSPVSGFTSPYRISLAGTGVKKWVNVLSLSNTNPIYDGTPKAVTVTNNPAVIVEVTYDGETNAPITAGVYQVIATVNDPTYCGAVTGIFDLVRRPLTITSQDAVRGYGDSDPVFTYTMTNFAPGEDQTDLTVLPSVSTIAVSNTPVGAYALIGSGGVASNYAFVYSNATLTITQVLLTARADDLSRYYGASNPVLTLSYTGFRNGETDAVLSPAPTASTLATTNSPVGTYPITVSGGAATNYTLQLENGELTVFGTLADISLTNLFQLYDGTPRSATVITVPPDIATRVTYDGTTNLPINVGSYLVVGTITNPNYSGMATGILNIAKGLQVISVFNPTSGVYPSEQVITLVATGTASGNPITYEIVSGPVVLEGTDQLRFTGPGAALVRACQNGNASWDPSLPVTNQYDSFDTNEVHYVAQAGQMPQWPFVTEGTAASNIQAAVDVASDGDEVRVGAGWYASGERVGAGFLTNRLVLDKAIRVRSADGPAATVIAGQAGEGAEAPLGASAIRCVYLTNNAVLIGFTLTNGFTAGTNTALVMDQRGGGALLTAGTLLSNCVAVGNGAVYGGGMFGGAAVQTRLLGNLARLEGGGASYALLNNSLLAGNQARYGGGAFRSTVSSCTVADNAAENGGGVYEGTIENSISWYNAGNDVLGSLVNHVCAQSGVIPGVSGNRTNPPLFEARASGNYALSHYSPCINAGTNGLLLTNGLAGSRFDAVGQDRILHDTTDLGAFEYNGVPGIPVMLPAEMVQAHQFQAMWNAPATSVPFQVYRVELTNRADVLSSEISTQAGHLTNRLFSGLLPGTEYAYQVRTENEFSNSAWSGWMSVTTLTEGAIGLTTGLVFSAIYGSGNPASADVWISNGGQTAFTWTNTVTFVGGTGVWLTLQPSAGQLDPGAQTALVCSVSVDGLDAGTYAATTRVSSATATNSPVEAPMVLILSRGLDVITFDSTNQIYTGSPLSVGAVSAHGQPVEVTYNGDTNPPTDAGTYVVTGSVDTLNWAGTNTAVLVIDPAPQTISQFLPASGSFESTNILSLTALGGGSGNPVTFSIVDGPGILLPGNQLRFTGYGTVGIEAAQAGNVNWEPAPTVTNSYTVIPAPNLIHYVAQVGQTSIWPYATWDQAATTLQDAADAAWDGDQIQVAAGVYSTGGRTAPGFGLLNRLYLSRTVSVESVEGPDLTIIEGHAGADAGFGLGAVRCVYLTNSATLTGFTLRDGATLGSGDLFQDRSGGAVLLYDGCRVTQCKLTANRALDYGGGAFFLNGGELESCLVISNEAARGAGAYHFQGGIIRNCTIADNAADEYAGGVFLLDAGQVINSISWFNAAGIWGDDLWTSGTGMVIRYTSAPEGVDHGVSGCQTNDPSFVNRLAGDYHLAIGSPCIGAGDIDAAQGLFDLDLDVRVIDTVEIGMDEIIDFSAAPIVLPPTGVTQTDFRARWKAPNSLPVTNYVLVLEEMVSGIPRFSNGLATATFQDFATMPEGTEFRYRLYGETIYGPSPWSEWMMVTTKVDAILTGPTDVVTSIIYGDANPAGLGMALSNQGDLSCVWSNEFAYDGLATGWLNLVPAFGVMAGHTTTNLILAVDATGLGVGTYQVTNTLISSATNATQTFVVSLTVSQRVLNVVCDNLLRGYGDSNPALTLTVTNFAPGEGVAQLTGVPLAATLAETSSPAGVYAITASGGAASNYLFNYVEGTLTITQVVLTVQANDQTRMYGTTNAALTLTYTGFRNGEDETVLSPAPTVSTLADSGSSVGSYDITVSGGAATNYALQRINGSLTITAAPAGVTITNLNPVYTGSPLPVTVATTPTGIAVQVTYDGVTNLPVNVGSYSVVAQVANPNYAGAATATLTIAKADQIIGALIPPGGGYPADQVLNLAVTGSVAGVAPVFEVVSGPGQLQGGQTMIFTATGTVAVRAWHPADSNWNVSAHLTNQYWADETNLFHYVARAGQTSQWPYASWNTAASNIQEAVDVAADDDTVWVGSGIYNQGVRREAGSSLDCRLIVPRRVTVRSVNGAAATRIVGVAAPAGGGNGTGAVRCVSLSAGAVLDGFTLTNGHTLGLSAVASDRSGGGVWMTAGSEVRHCLLIRNAAAEFGGAVYLSSGGDVINSLVVSNAAQFGAGLYLDQSGWVRNCTVVGNVAQNNGGGLFMAQGGTAVNSIVYYNTDGGGIRDVFVQGTASVLRAVCARDSVVNGVEGCITNPPQFINPFASDYGLLVTSPCIDQGDDSFVNWALDWKGDSRQVGPVDLGIHEYTGAPAAPVILPPSNVHPFGFQGHWNAGNLMPVSNYVLAVVRVSDGLVVVSNSVGNVTQWDVSGLDPESVYQYRVGANNSYGQSVPSDWMMVTTLQAAALQGVTNLSWEVHYGDANPAGAVQQLTNAGIGDCTWSNQTTYAGSNSGWLTVFPDSGFLPGGAATSFSVLVDLLGLDAGVYGATNRMVSLATTNGTIEFVTTLTVLKMDQTIIFPHPGRIGLQLPVTLNATVSSGRPVQYSLISGPAVLASNQLTATGFGTITVRAEEPGDANHNPAIPVDATFVVGGIPSDYDGDGVSDQAVYDPTTGRWYIRSSDGTILEWKTQWGYRGAQAVSGDYDGDGRLDLAVFDPSNGMWYIRGPAGTNLAWNLNWGYAGVVPVAGDYNGDGADDLAVFDPATGRWFIRTLSGTLLAWDVPWGYAGVVPVHGDYDGDGMDDLAVYDPTNGRWYIRSLDGTLLTWATQWGYVGVVPVYGDYDGDGTDDLALYDATTGGWYIRTLDGTILGWDVKWGYRGTLAVPGDYNGDGAFDLGIYDPVTGKWFVREVDGALLLYDDQWGYAGAVPVMY